MEKKNLVIIGSGPAGQTAAIYAARARLHPLVFEGFMSGIAGGQLMTTTEVENFPGFPEGILGPELIDLFRKQAQRFDSEHIMEDVLSLDLSSHPFSVVGSKRKVLTNALIIATGAFAKRLDIPGARDGEFWQKGVSACAICDGAIPIFRGKELFVVGGGDSAMEESIFLTKYASHVYVVHRRDELSASKIMAERAMSHPKISILWNREMIQVLGDEVVREVVLRDVTTKKEEKRPAGGVFFAIGYQPNVGFLNQQLELNEYGYIMVKKGTSYTNKEGVFAAGDVQDPWYRQAITAAGSGCIAALDAERWLSEKGFVHF